jgi:hypothetical protein
MPGVLSFAIHHVTNAVVTVSEDGSSAEGRFYLLQTATERSDNRAIWIAGRYDDRFRRVVGEWRFERVAIQTRFLALYATGWGQASAEPRVGSD